MGPTVEEHRSDASRWRRIHRGAALVCLAAWFAGLLAVASGGLGLQGTKPHCPQGAAHTASHGQGHCAWHCDGLEGHAAAGRLTGSPLASVGYVTGSGNDRKSFSYSVAACPPRGPPSVVIA